VKRALAAAAWIDRLNNWLGSAVSWLVLAMAVVGAFNAIARYLGRYAGRPLTANVLLELQWYLFSVVFLLAAAWALRQDAHVRVDVLYGRLPARAQAWIDLLGGALLLLPFCLFVLVVSWPTVRASWVIREGSPDPGGLPRYPLKAIILVAFALLLLQGIAELVKAVARLRGDLPLERAAGLEEAREKL
jgi:TRAP-type mannitol/chloroaromatic compound transport system permease small subunit